MEYASDVPTMYVPSNAVVDDTGRSLQVIVAYIKMIVVTVFSANDEEFVTEAKSNE